MCVCVQFRFCFVFLFLSGRGKCRGCLCGILAKKHGIGLWDVRCEMGDVRCGNLFLVCVPAVDVAEFGFGFTLGVDIAEFGLPLGVLERGG